jgi:hypothetical protein
MAGAESIRGEDKQDRPDPSNALQDRVDAERRRCGRQARCLPEVPLSPPIYAATSGARTRCPFSLPARGFVVREALFRGSRQLRTEPVRLFTSSAVRPLTHIAASLPPAWPKHRRVRSEEKRSDDAERRELSQFRCSADVSFHRTRDHVLPQMEFRTGSLQRKLLYRCVTESP